jgi:hypothetical protein
MQQLRAQLEGIAEAGPSAIAGLTAQEPAGEANSDEMEMATDLTVRASKRAPKRKLDKPKGKPVAKSAEPRARARAKYNCNVKIKDQK